MKPFFIILLLVLPITISSFDNPVPVPDPEVFGKRVIETLKTGDTTVYKNAFKVDKEILLSFFEGIYNDPYSSIGKSEYFSKQVQEGSDQAVLKVSRFLTENIQVVEAWKEKEKIDLRKLGYLRTYFNFGYSQEEGIFEIKQAEVLARHDSSFYLLKFKDVILIGKNWYGGQLKGIVKLTSDFNESGIRYTYRNLSGITVADTTVSVVEEKAIVKEEEDISKRMQKKRERLYRKLDKLDGN
jgi:hypothetical protein